MSRYFARKLPRTVLAVLRSVRHRNRNRQPVLDPRLKVPSGISVDDRPVKVAQYTNGTVVLLIPKSSGVQELRWIMSPEVSIEIHGHCLAIYNSDRVKIGEAFIEARVPVSLEQFDGSSHVGGSPAGTGVRVRSSVPHGGAKFCIRYRNFRLVDRGIQSSDIPWHRWHAGDRSLTYLLEHPITGAGLSRLVVVFSAISKPYDFTYNYRAAISDADSYRLFILDDFGSRGAYYFADHRDRTIYDSVQSFLRYILLDLGIAVTAVTFAGSSKGGTAALIHGLPMGISNIVVGAPQFLPGTYLLANAPEILSFVTSDSGITGRDWLDAAVGQLVSAESPGSHVRILVGEADHHLSKHVRPLEDMLRTSGTQFHTLIVQGVSHQEIGRPFSMFLRQSVEAENSKSSEEFLPYELTWQSKQGDCALLKVWVPQGEVIAIRAYAGSQELASHDYSSVDSYSFTVPERESLRVRIYRKNARSGQGGGAFTTRWLRPPPQH